MSAQNPNPCNEKDKSDQTEPCQSHEEKDKCEELSPQRFAGLLGALSRQFEKEGLTHPADEFSWEWHETFDSDFADALGNTGADAGAEIGTNPSGLTLETGSGSSPVSNSGPGASSPGSSGSGFDLNLGGCDGSF